MEYDQEFIHKETKAPELVVFFISFYLTWQFFPHQGLVVVVVPLLDF